MRLSTSTCILEHTLWKKDRLYVSCEDSIRTCAESGFSVLDFNFDTYSRKGQPFGGPGWEDWLKRQKELADSLNIEFSQGHAYYYLWSNTAPYVNPEYEELIFRSIIGASILGIPWLVIHPGNIDDADGKSMYEASLHMNLERYKRYGELAARHGVHIAIENLPNHGARGRFSTDEHDLLTLMDRLNDPTFGICWDVGHGNLNVPDQAASLRAVAPYLHALHIHDNHGTADEHLLPFQGKVNWELIMRTLQEIGYPGDFTYEISNYTRGMPLDFQAKAVRFAYELGMYLLDLANPLRS